MKKTGIYCININDPEFIKNAQTLNVAVEEAKPFASSIRNAKGRGGVPETLEELQRAMFNNGNNDSSDEEYVKLVNATRKKFGITEPIVYDTLEEATKVKNTLDELMDVSIYKTFDGKFMVIVPEAHVIQESSTDAPKSFKEDVVEVQDGDAVHKIRSKRLYNVGLKALRLDKQRQNLLEATDDDGNRLFSVQEISVLSLDIAYGLSDFLSLIQQNSDEFYKYFGSLMPSFNDSSINKEEEFKQISRKTHRELVELIGAGNLLSVYAKKAFMRPFDRRTGLKARNIHKNFEVFVELGRPMFNFIEGFALGVTERGYDVVEEFGVTSEELLELVGEVEVMEEEGKTEEHWDRETKTIAAVDQLTPKVRQKLAELKLLYVREAQTLDEELEIGGKSRVEIATNEFGIEKRIDIFTTTRVLSSWFDGAVTIIEVLSRLQEKIEEGSVWAQPIYDMLADTSGKYSDFQNEFMTVMVKYFNPYCTVYRDENNQIVSTVHNMHPFSDKFSDQLLNNLDERVPLFTVDGNINEETANELYKLALDITKIRSTSKNFVTDENGNEIYTDKALNEIKTKLSVFLNAFGADSVKPFLATNKSTDDINTMVRWANTIAGGLHTWIEKAKKDDLPTPTLNEYRRQLKYGYSNFFQPLLKSFEDSYDNSFYTNGKTYQSRVNPSFFTQLITAAHSDNETFRKFIEKHYGQSEWFYQEDSGKWRLPALRDIMGMSAVDRKAYFRHKTNLATFGNAYMRDMKFPLYPISNITEYFSERFNNSQYTWYGFPMTSNKPSFEFFMLRKFSDRTNYKRSLASRYYEIAKQEFSRIQTVKQMKEKYGVETDEGLKIPETHEKYIANFSENGDRFHLLTWLNDALDAYENREELKSNWEDRTSDEKAITDREKMLIELGELITKKTDGKSIDEAQLEALVAKYTQEVLDERAEKIINEYKESGLIEHIKNIKGLRLRDENNPDKDYDFTTVEEALTNFVWNDTFANLTMQELLAIDPAYYKDTEDLQKRFAEVRSPGMRCNIFARDYAGTEVVGENKNGDKIFRTITLSDLAGEGIISNAIANLEECFDRMIDQATTEADKKAAKAYKQTVMETFSKIEVTDGQAFTTPTGYRKKAFSFGCWSQDSEKVWEKIRNGEVKDGSVDFSTINTTFQPFKMFTYGFSTMKTDVENAPIQNLTYGVQQKNAEYLLVLADAIIEKYGQDIKRPNLLRALFNVMEKSATNPDGTVNPNGIDTATFASGVKTGLRHSIDLNQCSTTEEAEELLESMIYVKTERTNPDNTVVLDDNGNPIVDISYNEDMVQEISAEDYLRQQVVPDHKKDHKSIDGSQKRYEVPAESSQGKEFTDEYEKLTSENIEESISDLLEEFGITEYGGGFFRPTLSKLDRNLAIYQALLREAIGPNRFDNELLSAITVDMKTGDFKMPLGDPAFARRIEAYIHSLVKNKINKQEVSSTPLVQVTSWGTTEELSIIFKDRSGGILETRRQFGERLRQTEPNLTDTQITERYKKHLKEHQGGVAYYEAYVSIGKDDVLFKRFADKNGNIDIAAVEKFAPELLERYAYRIPTEDKYSMMPIKIVGFLPKETGDAIMLPYDITAITGADFDVDKLYTVKKDLSLKELRPKALIQKVTDLVKQQGFELSEEESTKITNEIEESYDRKANAITERGNKIQDRLKIQYNDKIDAAAADGNLSEVESLRQELDNKLKEAKENTENLLDRNEENKNRAIDKALSNNKLKSQVFNLIKNGLMGEEARANAENKELFDAVKDAYVQLTTEVVYPPEDTRAFRNNRLFDMTMQVLTDEKTAAKMLNPGSFENIKSIAYKVEAYKNGEDWESLEGLSSGELKTKMAKLDNMAFIDTRTKLYALNAAAAKTIGIAASQKSIHNVLSNDNLFCTITDIPAGYSIDGFDLSGRLLLDRERNQAGEYIGKTIGSFVGASADAAKDPVLNYLNLDETTLSTVLALIRVGMPLETASLLAASAPIAEISQRVAMAGVDGNYATVTSEVTKEVNKLRKKLVGVDSNGDKIVLDTLSVTKEDLIRALKPELVDEQLKFKILSAWQRALKIERALKGIGNVARFNSVTSAPGPTYLDDIMMTFKFYGSAFSDTEEGYQIRQDDGSKEGKEISASEFLTMHPIINSFWRAYAVAKNMLPDMPANSNEFNSVVMGKIPLSMVETLRNDRRLLNKLYNYYTSFLLVKNGAVDPYTKGAHSMEYLIKQFPKDFIKVKKALSSTTTQDYADKDLPASLRRVIQVGGNAFIDNLYVGTERLKNNNVRYVIKSYRTEANKIPELKAAWTDLHKNNPEVSMQLFLYGFYKGGLGFSPKTFMNLVPLELRQEIPNYKESFTDIDSQVETLTPREIFTMFVRHNTNNKRLVQRKKPQSINKIGGNLYKATFYKNEQIPAYFVNTTGDATTRQEEAGYVYVRETLDDVTISSTDPYESDGKVEVEYRKLSVLGNNGEYLEFSNDVNYEAMNPEGEYEGSYEETYDSKANLERADSDVEVGHPDISEQKDVTAQAASDITGIIDKFTEIKSKMRAALEEKDVTIDEDTEKKIEEMAKEFCVTFYKAK